MKISYARLCRSRGEMDCPVPPRTRVMPGQEGVFPVPAVDFHHECVHRGAPYEKDGKFWATQKRARSKPL
jgi:hypothetical protein